MEITDYMTPKIEIECLAHDLIPFIRAIGISRVGSILLTEGLSPVSWEYLKLDIFLGWRRCMSRQHARMSDFLPSRAFLQIQSISLMESFWTS